MLERMVAVTYEMRECSAALALARREAAEMARGLRLQDDYRREPA